MPLTLIEVEEGGSGSLWHGIYGGRVYECMESMEIWRACVDKGMLVSSSSRTIKHMQKSMEFMSHPYKNHLYIIQSVSSEYYCLGGLLWSSSS
jgi:hypothetical protein